MEGKSIQAKANWTLLTRKETADLLKVDLVTLWAWTSKGKLQSYQLGRKIFYYKEEVLSSLIPINNLE